LKFRISVVSQEASTLVSVQNATGQADRSDNAQRILKVIAADLK
jgi:outer membrane protein assembly factor BamC